MGMPISGVIRRPRCSRCSIPNRTATFNDHYLEVDYDLSNIMFVTTANTLNIPGPLMDRMEIIRIAGYTEEEKAEIARKHLIPQRSHQARPGFAKEWTIDDDALMMLMIRRYTREAGVRNLEREISTPDPQGGEGDPAARRPKVVTIDADKVVEEYLGRAEVSAYGEIERRKTRWAPSRGWPGPRSAGSC